MTCLVLISAAGNDVYSVFVRHFIVETNPHMISFEPDGDLRKVSFTT